MKPGRREARVEQPIDLAQVPGVLFDHERAEVLTDERGEQRCPQLPLDAADPSVALASDDDQSSLGRECLAKRRDGSAPEYVDDEVIGPTAVCEGSRAVVDDVVDPERSRVFDAAAAAHAADLGTGVLRELRSE